MAEAGGLSLLEALSAVPDPRGRKGRRHPLGTVLALLSVAMMCGAGACTRPCSGGATRARAWPASWGWAGTASPRTG